MEEGGASGRKDNPRSGGSEWLPNGEADQDQPERGGESRKAKDGESRKAKGGDGQKAKPASQAKAKPPSQAKAKPASQAKAKPASQAKAKPASQAKAKPSNAARSEKTTQPAARAKQSAQGPEVEDKAKANREELGRRQERMRMSSDVDALGQDKHRTVIGQHNPNRGKQLLYYGVFIAFVVVAYLGLSAAVKQLDKAPAHDPAKAPWAQPGAPQNPLGGFAPSRQGQKGPTHFQ